MALRTAVIGLGNMGRKHIEVVQKLHPSDATVVAVSDLREELVWQAMDDFDVGSGQQEWRTTVTDPSVDVVHVCTPNSSHFEISRVALCNGKHVVSEKPLALTAEEVAELLQIASKNGLVGAVNHTYRGYEAVQLARRLVGGGELGALRVIRGGYLQDWLLSPQVWDWRIDPELCGPSRAIGDIGSHWVDLAAHLTGRTIRRLTSDFHVVMPVRRGPGVPGGGMSGTPEAVRSVMTEDYASVLFHTDDARGVFTVSQVSPGHQNSLWLEVDGSAGSLRWSSEEPEVLELRRMGERSRISVLTRVGNQSDAEENDIHALRRVLSSAYAQMGGVDPPPTGAFLHAGFGDGYYVASVIESILESVRTGRWIDLLSSSSDRTQ